MPILYIDGIVVVVEEVSVSGNSDRGPQFDSTILVSNRRREREMIRIAAFVHRSQDWQIIRKVVRNEFVIICSCPKAAVVAFR